MRTSNEMTEMAGNPLICESPDFRHLGLPTPRHTRKHPFEISRAEFESLLWTGSLFEQVLIVPCKLTKDEMAEIVGNPLFRKSPDCQHLKLPNHGTRASIRSK